MSRPETYGMTLVCCILVQFSNSVCASRVSYNRKVTTAAMMHNSCTDISQ